MNRCHHLLATGLRARLAESLAIDTTELDSIIKALRSNLELSLGAHSGGPE